MAKELADWLINNNVVEHIFGPNLHIEVSPSHVDAFTKLASRFGFFPPTGM